LLSHFFNIRFDIAIYDKIFQLVSLFQGFLQIWTSISLLGCLHFKIYLEAIFIRLNISCIAKGVELLGVVLHRTYFHALKFVVTVSED
jgi:hypothetical protein